MDLSVVLPTASGGLKLKNPIMPAASTFGNVIEYGKVFDLSLLGALVPNSMYLDGGQPTRAFKFHRGEVSFMSAFGKNSIPIKAFVEDILPHLPYDTTPVIIDLKEGSIEAMEELVAYVAQTGKVAGVEINLNCPYDKTRPTYKYWHEPDALLEFVTRVKAAAGTLMVGAKAPTGLYDVGLITGVLHRAGLDSFTCYNGAMGSAIDLDTGIYQCGASGSSAAMGYGYRPLGLSCTKEAVEAAPIAVIGSGGIISAENVLEHIMIGAYAVQVGSSNFMRPDFMPRLVDELAELMHKKGIQSLDEVRGTARCNQAIRPMGALQNIRSNNQ